MEVKAESIEHKEGEAVSIRLQFCRRFGEGGGRRREGEKATEPPFTCADGGWGRCENDSSQNHLNSNLLDHDGFRELRPENISICIRNTANKAKSAGSIKICGRT